MVKIFFVAIALLFFKINVQAIEGFHCIPSLRQTRLQVLVKNNVIELMIINAGGYDFMPQFDGSGSKFGLSFNKMQAEDLKEMAEGFVLSWPQDKCKINSENFSLNCSGEALQQIGSIKSYGITTTEITEKYDDTVYEKRKFRLSAEKDNTYFVSLEFYKQTCEKF